MEAKIIFGNGEIITAEKNGESLITKKKPGFPTELGLVKVESELETRAYNEPSVVECASIDGRYWFCFVEESQQEKRIRQLTEENEILVGNVKELASTTDDMVLLMAELIGGM